MYVAKRKRVVKLGREIDLGDFYLTDFVQPYSYGPEEAVKQAWENLMGYYKADPEGFVRLMNLIGLFNMYVKELWNLVNTEIKYRHDDPVFQTPDFWLLPNETWKQKEGDCEDTTFMLLSAIYRVKRGWEANDEVARRAVAYGCIGYYVDYSGAPYGHGFIIYSTDRILNGRELWIETTLESEVSQSIWYLADFNRLVPVYFFTDRECFRIDKDYERLGLTEDYVDKHRDLIDAMIEYVETGRRLKVKWMHKGRRTPQLTGILIT
ncbi:MAG: hypothetical protein DRO12_05890 [Thermoprotei archaeon]|nr:MAG: hypothetical protein DRO12_05890 [Thermoprotei archaeon]